MKTKKIYSLSLGSSAWGNGGEWSYYESEHARDQAAEAAHPMDNPTKGEFNGVEIDGKIYFPLEEVELSR